MINRNNIVDAVLKNFSCIRHDVEWKGKGGVTATLAVSDLLVGDNVAMGTMVESEFTNGGAEVLATVSSEYVMQFKVPEGITPAEWVSQEGEDNILRFGEESLYPYHRELLVDATIRMGLPPYRLPYSTLSPVDHEGEVVPSED
jgi:hypothetical protein